MDSKACFTLVNCKDAIVGHGGLIVRPTISRWVSVVEATWVVLALSEALLLPLAFSTSRCLVVFFYRGDFFKLTELVRRVYRHYC